MKIALPSANNVLGRGKSRKSKQGEWEPIATFVIEIELRAGKGKRAERRTRAHHHEASIDKEWPGFAKEALCRWMAEQLGERNADAAEVDRARRAANDALQRAQLAEGPAADWEIATVRLVHTSGADRTLYDRGRSTPAIVAARAPFVTELALEPTQVDGVDRARARLDSVRYRAYNRDSGARVELGESPVTIRDPRQAPTPLTLVNVASLPSAGLYRLECVPVVAGVEVRSACASVPMLQVI
jgi:hypothetical protein